MMRQRPCTWSYTINHIHTRIPMGGVGKKGHYPSPGNCLKLFVMFNICNVSSDILYPTKEIKSVGIKPLNLMNSITN